MIGVFARPNHPIGYGYPNYDDPAKQGKAHGYVVLLVRCHSRSELNDVATRLNDWKNPFHGIQQGSPNRGYMGGWLGEWYGGQFDLVAVLPTDTADVYGYPPYDKRFVSKGDNRFVGLYEASEVLLD